MNSPIGNQLLHKVRSCDAQNFDSVKSFVLNQLEQVTQLEKRYSRKWDDKSLVEWIYKPRNTIKKEQDIEMYYKANLHLAIYYFENLIKSIKDYQDLSLYKEHINSFIYDIAVFIDFFETKTQNNYRFLVGGKSYYTDSICIRRASEDLFWQSPIDTIERQKIAFVLSVMTLRQSLEIRFKRICGIERVYPKSGGYISSNFFTDFIKKNFEYFEFPSDWSFPHILKVYEWTHGIVHNGFQPLIWQVQFALDFTRPLFLGGSYEPPDKSFYYSSIHGAVKIRNRTEMKNKLTESIVEHFDKKFPDTTITTDDIEFHWLQKPEAIDEEALLEENQNFHD